MSEFFPFSTIHEQFFHKKGEALTYKKGQLLVRGKDPAPWVFFLDKGIVKVTFAAADGTERILGYFLPGMTFAQVGSFFSDPNGSLEYQATVDCAVHRVSRSIFLKQLEHDTVFLSDYSKSIARNNIFLIERIVYQGENGVSAKCIHWLQFMAKYYGKKTKQGCLIDVPLTNYDIANFLHVTRESVNKILRQFEKAGQISINKKYITIHKLNQLKIVC